MRIAAFALLLASGLTAQAAQTPKETEIVAASYTITYREGWGDPTSDANVSGISHRSTGSTVQMRAGLLPNPEGPAAMEDSLYAGLRKQLTATIEPEDRHLGTRVWKMSEWKSSQVPNSRARWFILKENNFLFFAILTYSTNPDLCCVVTADADAAMATLKITVPTTAVRPLASGDRAMPMPHALAPRDLLGRLWSGESRGPAGLPVFLFQKP